MAKLIFTAAALFLLFAFSHARTPSDLPNGLDVVDEKISVTDADVKEATNTLRLPSERPESETVVDLDHESIAVAAEQPEFSATIVSNEENTADASKSETVPLTVISFRPVGRHFPRRPFPLSFRHGHRCRGGHRQSKFHGAEREKDSTNTPYGDDMILSSGEESSKFDHRSFRGGVRQIPARWANFRNGGPKFSFEHEDDNNMESERPRGHHRRHRHHDQEFDMEMVGEEQHREHKHDHDHDHKHKHGHGLFRSFRKFLNGF